MAIVIYFWGLDEQVVQTDQQVLPIAGKVRLISSMKNGRGRNKQIETGREEKGERKRKETGKILLNTKQLK